MQSVCFSCNCILVFLQQDREACGVALGEGCPCFIPLPSFPNQISEIKGNACPANACWCSPHRMEMPAAGVVGLPGWVRGELGASGIRLPCWVMHCTTQSGYMPCTLLADTAAKDMCILLGIVVFQEYVHIKRHHCTGRICAHLLYRLFW